MWVVRWSVRLYPPPTPCHRPFRLPDRYSIVRSALGVLLLLAAVLKLSGLGADPVARMGIFSAPEFQLAVIEFEVFLALWLLSGKRPLGSWLVALTAFAGFAAVSFYQGWIGQSSCGCFGRLSVSPWAAFTLDILILAALGFGCPDLTPLRDNPRRHLRGALLPAAWGIAGTAAIAGVLIGLAHLGFGSVPAAIAYFRGERVSIEPRLVDVGSGVGGESRRVSVTVTNWTDQPVHLFGGTADCSCSVLDDLPVTIPAGESRSVSLHVRLSGAPGVFTRKAGFLLEDEGPKRLDFRLTGEILRSKTRGPFHVRNRQ